MPSPEQLSIDAACGAVLQGTLTLPDGEPPFPAVVAVHGAEGATRDFHLFRGLASLLPALGIATLVFDRRGHGESTGGTEASYEELAADARAVIEQVRRHPSVAGDLVALWGISQGGWIAPLAAAQDGRVAALVAVSAAAVTPGAQMDFAVTALLLEAGHPPETVERALALRRHVDALAAGKASATATQALLDQAREEPWFRLAFIPDKATQVDESWSEEMEFDILSTLRRLQLPVLLFFGQGDRWIPIAESADAWRSALGANADLTVVSLPGAGHAATVGFDPGDWLEEGPVSPVYERVLARWLRDRLLPTR